MPIVRRQLLTFMACGLLPLPTLVRAQGRAGESDPLYDKAVDVVLKERRASISFVQRHLGIGYNRAANILEAMENAGIVSKASPTGRRDILVPTRD